MVAGRMIRAAANLEVVGDWSAAAIRDQAAEGDDADVLAHHASRSVAHRDSARARVEAVKAEVDIVRAIDEASRGGSVRIVRRTAGAGAVPSNVEPLRTIQPLSMQAQHPPALGNGVTGALATFTPRSHKSGRPASSAQKIVVDVPSMIRSIGIGNTPLRIPLKLSTPKRRV